MKNLRIKIIILHVIFFINLNSNSIANVSSNFINDITTELVIFCPAKILRNLKSKNLLKLEKTQLI